MAEYIEREAAINAMCRLCSDTTRDKCSIQDICNHVCRLEAVPAADVRPVVRGTWVGIDDFPHEDWECDNCGCVVGNTDDPWNYYHYCPNCGADMREADDEKA